MTIRPSERSSESSQSPSYLASVTRALASSPEPLSLEALISEVEQMQPLSPGGRGRSAVQRAVESLYQAVPVDSARIGWLPHLLRGCSIRHSLEADEARRGFVLLDELEHAFFFPEFFQEALDEAPRTLHIELFGGETIDAIAAAERDIWALHFDARFRTWLSDQGVMPNDDLVIRADDALQGRYMVRLQPREVRDEETIGIRNRQLARAAEEIAGEYVRRRSSLYTWELVARLIGRGVFRHPVPADDMHFVLEEYSRLHLVEGVGYELELAEPGKATVDRHGRTRGQVLLHGAASRPVESAGGISDNPDQRSQARGGSMDLFEFGGSAAGDEETCDAYDEYLEAHGGAELQGEPLSHDDFHLLEAELESLVDLELEFGYLLADQTARKQYLADHLFIDPETLVDGPWDEGDDLDADSPALWN